MSSIPERVFLQCSSKTPENDLQVEATTTNKLKAFQIEGVRFLYNQYLKKNGAVLNDDSKLGKTVQTVVCLSSIHVLKSSIRILVLCHKEDLHHWIFHFHQYSKLTASIYYKNISNANINCLISSVDMFPVKTCHNWDVIVVDDLHVDTTIKYLRSVKCKFKVWLAKDNLLIDTDKLFKILNWVSSENLDLKKEFQNYPSTSSSTVTTSWKQRQYLSIFCNRWLLRRTKCLVANHLPLMNPELFKEKLEKWSNQTDLLDENLPEIVINEEVSQTFLPESNNNYCDNQSNKAIETIDVEQMQESHDDLVCQETVKQNITADSITIARHKSLGHELYKKKKSTGNPKKNTSHGGLCKDSSHKKVFSILNSLGKKSCSSNPRKHFLDILF